MKKIYKILIITIVFSLFIFVLPVRAQIERNANTSVDLAWTCSSYTPVNYEGKSLPIRGSLIIVSAIPYFKINNRLAGLNDLTYKWFLDDEIIDNNNKPEFSFTATKYQSYSHKARVIVSTKDGTVSSQEWIDIKIYNSEIQIYEYDGAAQVNLTKGIGSEFSTYANSTPALTAIPYYFNINNLQDLSYNWKVQGTQLANQLAELPQIIELKIGSGSSYLEQTVSLISSNKYNALETSIKNFILKINE